MPYIRIALLFNHVCDRVTHNTIDKDTPLDELEQKNQISFIKFQKFLNN